MGLFGGFRDFAKRLGVLRRDEAHGQPNQPQSIRRTRVFETVEPRIMLNGIGVFDPIEVGAVYVEGDTGSDGAGDTIEITFNGGGPETRLDRVIISGDKAFDYDAFLANEAAGAAPLTSLASSPDGQPSRSCPRTTRSSSSPLATSAGRGR